MICTTSTGITIGINVNSQPSCEKVLDTKILLRPSMKERNSTCEMGSGRSARAGAYARENGENDLTWRLVISAEYSSEA